MSDEERFPGLLKEFVALRGGPASEYQVGGFRVYKYKRGYQLQETITVRGGERTSSVHGIYPWSGILTASEMLQHLTCRVVQLKQRLPNPKTPPGDE